MPFPAKLLNDSEEVILDLHPHWWFFTRSVFFLIVAMVAGVGANLVVEDNEVVGYIGAGLIVLALLYLFVVWLRWKTTNFVLTTDRLIDRQGVLARSGREIPLERINDITFHQSLFERLIRAGDLIVESGGTQGQQTFSDLAHPFEVQNAVYAAIEAAAARDAARAASAGGLSIPEQIEKLDDLRRRGAISDAEFEDKKRRLLDKI